MPRCDGLAAAHRQWRGIRSHSSKNPPTRGRYPLPDVSSGICHPRRVHCSPISPGFPQIGPSNPAALTWREAPAMLVAVDTTPDAVRAGLRAANYITNERVETAIFLALALEKPLLIEGPAGSGKTEVA